jgi:hypothetical protein
MKKYITFPVPKDESKLTQTGDMQYPFDYMHWNTI